MASEIIGAGRGRDLAAAHGEYLRDRMGARFRAAEEFPGDADAASRRARELEYDASIRLALGDVPEATRSRMHEIRLAMESRREDLLRDHAAGRLGLGEFRSGVRSLVAGMCGSLAEVLDDRQYRAFVGAGKGERLRLPGGGR